MKSLLCLVFLLPAISNGQVQHNFDMPPAHTDCHELPQQFNSSTDAIKAVDQAKFRLEETVKISRYRVPRSATFYSCDGTTGFLVVEEDKRVHLIFRNIPTDVWRKFIDSDDPVGFYAQHIKSIYSPIP